MAVATPTDRPKSVHNRCVIEGFGGVSVFVCWLSFSDGMGALVIRQSQISFFFDVVNQESKRFTKLSASHLEFERIVFLVNRGMFLTLFKKQLG